MPRMTILTERDLRSLVPLDRDAVETVENAFRQLASGKVVMPPILRLDIKAARGEVDVKTAYVPGLDGFAIKISPGFFDNPKLGLPSVNGLMVYLSARTGLVEALLLDNGYLTDVRTAAAGAVAARHLARADASVAAILGAGVQAELQLRALTLVRPIRAARIWARRTDAAEALAARASQALAIPVSAIGTAAEAVRGADIVVTTTPAETPILDRAWLAPGQHVTAMGSDAEHKNEIDPVLVADAIYVADSLAQTRRLGELRHAIAAGAVAPDRSFSELGAIIAGTAPGRRSPSDLTLCDLTGTGAQDTAIATLAVGRARAANAGAAFET
jgi:ornithine cyclodeaminase